jgi:hypothetical protein
MIIKGKFRDVLTGPGGRATGTGWTANSIVDDYGRFLAALMKKDFNRITGIEYMAVGSGCKDPDTFKEKVASFFNSGNLAAPYKDGEIWVWAAPVNKDDIKYLDPDGQETNRATDTLQVNVTFAENQPPETLVFNEFALLGIGMKEDQPDQPDTDKLFFVNYVAHGPITKDIRTVLTRTVKLTFPINKEEEES